MDARRRTLRTRAARAARPAVLAAAAACLLATAAPGGAAARLAPPAPDGAAVRLAAPSPGAPVAAPPTTPGLLTPWRLTGPTRTLVDTIVSLGEHGGSLLTESVDGVRRSVDLGATWTEPAGLPPTSPGATTSSSEIAVLASDPDIAYLLDSTRPAATPYDERPGPSLYRSADAGATWTAVESDALAGRIVFDIAVIPVTDGPPALLVLDGESGILRSVDGGITFAAATQGIPPDPDAGGIAVGAIAAGPQPGVAFAASPSALYRTTDGGASWRATCIVDDAMPCGRPFVAPGDGALVLLASSRGIVRSVDAGASWRQVGTAVLPGTDAGGIDTVAMSATDPPISVASGIAGLFRSRDGGSTWISWDGGITPSELGPSDRVAMDALDPAHAWRVHETTFLATADGGLTWRDLPGPDPTGVPAYAALPHEVAPGVIGTSDGIVARTDLRWVTASAATLAMSFAADPSLDGRVYAATYADGIKRSDDGGLTWEPWSTGLPRTIAWNVALLVLRSGRVLLATEVGTWERERDGARWDRLGASLPNAAARSLVVLPDGAVLVGLETRGVWRLDRGADFWRPLGLDGRTVLSLAVGPGDGRILFAATDGRGLYRSTDAGRTWKRVASTGASASVTFDPVTRVAVLATGTKVIESTDLGRTWHAFTTGLPGTDARRPWYRRTTAVAAMPGGGFVLTSFAGTFVTGSEARP